MKHYNLYTDHGNPGITSAAGAKGALTDITDTVTDIVKTARNIRNAKSGKKTKREPETDAEDGSTLSPLGEKVIEAPGDSRKNGCNASGAEKLIAEKLAG